MDFINLNTEYDTLNQLSKQGGTTLTNLNSFFKSMHKYCELLENNTKKASETMFSEMVKYDSKSTLSKNLFEFYRSYESFTTKVKSSCTKIEKELIEPINLFSKHLNGKYNEGLSEFKSLANSTYEAKKNLEKSKHRYFDSCKLAVEQEKVVIKVMDAKEQNLVRDEDIENAHDVLIKLRLQAENNCQAYKVELSKTNKLFEENEKKYFPTIVKFKNNEESRENFIKFHFEKFIKIMEEFKESIGDLCVRMSNSINEVKVEEDSKIVDEKLNFLYRNNERIPKEEFLNYDIYRRNLEKMLINSQIIAGKDSKDCSSSLNISEFSQNDYLSNTTTTQENQALADDDELIEIFFTSIKDKETEIGNEELSKLIEAIDNNIPFSKLFIDKLLVNYKRCLYIEIPNFQNLKHFANLLVSITNNTEVKKELFEMNFAIIYIAEKTFHRNPENTFNKIYLCKILSRNKIYNDKKFWLDLMNIKINSLIESKINIELQKREKEANNLNSTNPNEPPSSPKRTSILSIGSRVKNLFLANKIKENQKIESSMIQTSLYENIKTTEACSVVKEYILHFSNFSFDVSDSIDIIVELGMSYNYEKEKVSFFISLLNSNLFTIKNKQIKQIVKVDYEKNYMNSNFRSYLKLNDCTMTNVALSLRYLEIKDYVNIIALNKNFCKKISRIVYKNVLFRYHGMDTKLRLSIWKSLLNIYELKKTVKYQEILEEMNNQDHTALLDMITLDVQRTAFDGNNTEFKRSAILNILKAAAYKKPHINYCQGMNYVTAFIYQITNDEEEAFYFFYGILNSTEYGDIFLNELKKLKQFFYVFERLLFIYTPELSIYLKNNSISVSYFVSPWFITLFTNSYQYINNTISPKILIRIWDEFMLNGWKSIIKSGLCLIKHYENNLLSLKYEDLLHFLINDIIKYGFFQNSNYDYFINLTENLNLPSGLLSNLENEFNLESKLKEAEEKHIEDQKKISYEKENTIKI